MLVCSRIMTETCCLQMHDQMQQMPGLHEIYGDIMLNDEAEGAAAPAEDHILEWELSAVRPCSPTPCSSAVNAVVQCPAYSL